MSLDAMFAVLALLIAVYAIMPRTSKLDLKIRLNRFDYVIAIFLVGLRQRFTFLVLSVGILYTPYKLAKLPT